MYKHYLPLFLIIAFLSSCYSYGPTHAPYTASSKREVPAPVEKLVGKPYSKKEYIDKVAAQIKNDVPEAEVTIIEDSIKVLFPKNILYQSKGIFPSDNYQEPLGKLSSVLKKYNKTDILITGHTDDKGDDKKNKTLSLHRANAIKAILEDNGIPAYRLETWGMGENAPLYPNDTVENREKNRRVEFVVLYRY
ncbi:MAG: OmpA family protein [Chitinophagaceae bacterium]